MLTSKALYLTAATGRDIVVNVPAGSSFWQTAIVAVGAALLGSAVGGYASFRANEALETRRRAARAKIRRKAKVYTPIRSELVALQATRDNGSHFGTWGILRKSPPPLLRTPASLHLWKDLVDDGRSLTAASEQIRADLDKVDKLADAFNGQLAMTREVFSNRGPAILAEFGEEIHLVNWVETDTPALLRNEFDDLGITGTRYGTPLSPTKLESFEAAWTNDDAIQDTSRKILARDAELGAAVDRAIRDLESAMRRIAKKYERESAED